MLREIPQQKKGRTNRGGRGETKRTRRRSNSNADRRRMIIKNAEIQQG